MNVLEKLYILVKTLNVNDDNKEKCYGVSTDSIRKLTDSFFIIIGEKASTNIPLRKIYRFKESATLTRLYVTIYLNVDDYPPHYDKK